MLAGLPYTWLCDAMNSLPRTRISTFRRLAEHGLFIDLADVVLLGKGSEVLEWRCNPGTEQ